MADFLRREVTITWVEYELKTPTEWVEVQKVLAALNNDLAGIKTWSDTVEVLSDDEKIVFRYDKAVLNRRGTATTPSIRPSPCRPSRHRRRNPQHPRFRSCCASSGCV